MSIYKRLNIKSNVRNYAVSFSDDFKDGWEFGTDKKKFLIVDRNVARFYKKELRPILDRYPYFIVEASEAHKTLDYIKVIIRSLIDHNIKRDYTLVAIGGGIIQDITAFIASILYRGMGWIFYPTTLLAQSDSCIGSKTSINIDELKNQVGNFYPPRAIFLNTRFLDTLSSTDIRSGLGEIIKVHLIDGEKSFRYVLRHYDRSLLEPRIMADLIYRALKIKKRVIEKDEFDTGYRNIMNYGHTFGHALESLTDYKLCHGQAITIGMDISNYLSCKLGYMPESAYFCIRGILMKNMPTYDFKGLDLDLFFKSLAKDKKNIGKDITVILSRGPGRMMKKRLPLDTAMKKYIEFYFDNMFPRSKV